MSHNEAGNTRPLEPIEMSMGSHASESEVVKQSEPVTRHDEGEVESDGISREEPKRHRILIVDDHPLTCRYLVQRLSSEPRLQVVGWTDNASDAAQRVAMLRPDLVLVDLALVDGGGLELIAKLRELTPRTRTLVWTMLDATLFAGRAFRAGASGYVSEHEPVERVIEAILHILGRDR